MEVILWDWDNTLVDTLELVRHALNAALEEYNLPLLTSEQMNEIIHCSGKQIFAEFFPNHDFHEVSSVYSKHYQKDLYKLQLIPGAMEILKWTKEKGFTNILASSKKHTILRQEAEISGLIDYIDNICGREQFSENKPSKVFTDAALANFKDYHRLFVVGDGVEDILMARNYENATAILMRTDPKRKEFEKNQPDFFVTNLMELKKYLDKSECE